MYKGFLWLEKIFVFWIGGPFCQFNNSLSIRRFWGKGERWKRKREKGEGRPDTQASLTIWEVVTHKGTIFYISVYNLWEVSTDWISRKKANCSNVDCLAFWLINFLVLLGFICNGDSGNFWGQDCQPIPAIFTLLWSRGTQEHKLVSRWLNEKQQQEAEGVCTPSERERFKKIVTLR